MRKQVLFAVGLLTVAVLLGGCIEGSQEGSTLTSDSTVLPRNSSTPAVVPVLVLPAQVSFNATLTILSENVTVVRYSYAGTVDYKNGTADITMMYVYHPNDPRLTGNWHVKRVVIGSDGHVRVFISPPSSWMPVPENATQRIREDVFDRNPYHVFFNLIKNSTQCSNCTSSVALPREEAIMLLHSFTSDSRLSVSSLKGTVSIKNGKVTSVALEGAAEDRIYVFKLEVSDK